MTRTVVRITWNLRFSGRPQTLAQRERPEWYRFRWQLWKEFTEPSLLRQTHADFEAWLLCDPALRHLTEWMEGELPDERFRIVYDLHEAARCVAVAKPERIVLARIDNDDAYAADALAVYHVAADSLGDRNTIQFAEGWVWDRERGKLYESANPSPAFLAMVGDWRMMARGFPALGNHSKAQYTALRVPGHRWLMVAHGNNVCNRAAGGWVGREVAGAERKSILAEYGIEEPTDG